MHTSINIDLFKDRALCISISKGLNRSGTIDQIQLLIPYDPVQYVLFDSSINQSLIPVFKQMEQDSIEKIHTVAEAAQGRPVFERCMEYYKSKGLEELAKKEVKEANKIKNLEEHISNNFPSW